MRFIDYPDHLPVQPPSPEMLAILDLFKALAATLDIKIEVTARLLTSCCPRLTSRVARLSASSPRTDLPKSTMLSSYTNTRVKGEEDALARWLDILEKQRAEEDAKRREARVPFDPR